MVSQKYGAQATIDVTVIVQTQSASVRASVGIGVIAWEAAGFVEAAPRQEVHVKAPSREAITDHSSSELLHARRSIRCSRTAYVPTVGRRIVAVDVRAACVVAGGDPVVIISATRDDVDV